MTRRRLVVARDRASACIAVGAAIVFARASSAGARARPCRPRCVTKGPLKVTIHANGELRAGRTMTLVTPPVGGMLRIVQMKTTGMPVKSGEVVMEFDPADQSLRPGAGASPKWPKRNRKSSR